METPDTKPVPSAFDRTNKFERPLYSQAARMLADMIARDCAAGDRFYTDRELMNLLQISQPTVRRAVDELVRQGVLERRIGRGTRVLKTHLGRHLGLFLPSYTSPMQMSALESYAGLSEEYGYSLSVHFIRQRQPVSESVRALRRGPNEERLVFLGVTDSDAMELCRATQELGYRSVLAAPPPAGYPGSSVCVDNAAGVDIAVDHLLALGHQRIAFLINEPIELGNIATRLQRIQEVIAEKKLLRARVFDCELPNWTNSFDAAYQKMAEIAAMKPMPTAVYCVSGIGAWAVLQFSAERGIRVPEQLSVLGVDNLLGSDRLFPPLTTLTYDHNIIAAPAAQCLWSQDATPKGIVIRPELIVRSSTGPAVQ